MDVGNKLVFPMCESIKIIVNNEIIDNNKLEWRIGNDGHEELTLNEISKQLYALGTIIYVWVELGLSGKIYQYGNYSDKKWCVHGATKGYA